MFTRLLSRLRGADSGAQRRAPPGRLRLIHGGKSERLQADADRIEPDFIADLGPPPTPGRSLPIAIWDQPASFLASIMREGIAGEVAWPWIWQRYLEWCDANLMDGEEPERSEYVSQRLERLGCTKLGLVDAKREPKLARGRKRVMMFRIPGVAGATSIATPVVAPPATLDLFEPLRRAA